jgi:hypothetical protein
MYFTVLMLLAVLVLAVCFWREIAPCLAWAALSYHATPEMIACLNGELTGELPGDAALATVESTAEATEAAQAAAEVEAPATIETGEAFAAIAKIAAIKANATTDDEVSLSIFELSYDPLEHDIAAVQPAS